MCDRWRVRRRQGQTEPRDHDHEGTQSDDVGVAPPDDDANDAGQHRGNERCHHVDPTAQPLMVARGPDEEEDHDAECRSQSDVLPCCGQDHCESGSARSMGHADCSGHSPAARIRTPTARAATSARSRGSTSGRTPAQASLRPRFGEEEGTMGRLETSSGHGTAVPTAMSGQADIGVVGTRGESTSHPSPRSPCGSVRERPCCASATGGRTRRSPDASVAPMSPTVEDTSRRDRAERARRGTSAPSAQRVSPQPRSMASSSRGETSVTSRPDRAWRVRSRALRIARPRRAACRRRVLGTPAARRS